MDRRYIENLANNMTVKVKARDMCFLVAAFLCVAASLPLALVQGVVNWWVWLLVIAGLVLYVVAMWSFLCKRKQKGAELLAYFDEHGELPPYPED